MTKIKDYEGFKYGRLTVTKEWRWKYINENNKLRRRQLLCECTCGNFLFVDQSSLSVGNTKSCGCLSRDTVIKRNKETASLKGASKHRHYKRWRAMINRCYEEKNEDYSTYGRKGIKVCSEWKENPWAFFKWIEESNWEENKGLTLDRIDTNGDYEPKNCTFSNHYQQAINKNISKHNKSGYIGVNWDKNKWCARISVQGKRITLGRFETKKEAISVRKEAELKHYGKVLHPYVDNYGHKKTPSN